MKFIISLFLLLAAYYTTNAQNFFAQDNTIPVSNGTKQLKYPWAGGLNNPQFAAADLDGDGTDDLVVLNRGAIAGGQYVLTFINGGTPNQVDYTYAPEYTFNLPPLEHWMLSNDFNCDGVPDFITSAAPAVMMLYTGTRLPNGRLQYAQQGFLNYTTQTGTTGTNIFVSPVDIPAMIDVNDDGDVDVLTFDFSGFKLEYYENLSVETGNGCGDTIGFEIRSYCWDEFEETGITKAVNLFLPCGAPKTDGEVEGSARHAGSSVMAFDENGDGLKEVLLGDITFQNVVKLLNGGRLDSAVAIAQDSVFPSYNRSIDLPVFPACFYTDVNNDGKEDLLVAPNTPNRGLNHNCAWWYKDTSSNANVVFEFQTDSFMTNDMLDFGEGAYPAFADINGDGLMDMVVGNSGYYENTTSFISGLALLINVGTASAPAYKLIDTDYMGFSNFTTGVQKIRSIVPAFGDMNGDGAIDMIVGDQLGSLHYFPNQAAAGDSMELVIEPTGGYQYKDIDVGNFAKPEIFDVNGDNLPDLIVGRAPGSLYYYENIGTTTNPNFNSIPSNYAFGEVLVKVNSLDGLSAPRVVYLAHNTQPYLMVSNLAGYIELYELNASQRYSGRFKRVNGFFSGIDIGESASLAVADIDNDGKWEMAVGSKRGGINFYQETDYVGINDAAVPVISARAYPNPSDGNWQIALGELTPNAPMVISIVDVLGKEVYTSTHTPVDTKTSFPIQLQVGSSIYFCRVQQGASSTVFRLLAH